MLRAILNKSWRQHPTRHQLYGHLPPITKTIQVRRTRHAGHCWGNRDGLISDVLLWTPTYGRAKAGRPVRTYIQQPCEDTGNCPEDLPEAMNDREMWRKRVRDIRASGTIWWWWYVIYIIITQRRLLRMILRKSWEQYATKHQLYGHQPPITKTIQIRRKGHVGHCWRNKDELMSNVHLWTSSHGCASVGPPARSYLQQFCTDTGCGLNNCFKWWMIESDGKKES